MMATSSSCNARDELGISCPRCYGIQWRVYLVRGRRGFIMRVRVCKNCGHRIRTKEEIYAEK